MLTPINMTKEQWEMVGIKLPKAPTKKTAAKVEPVKEPPKDEQNNPEVGKEAS